MKKNIFVTLAAMTLAVSAMQAQDLDPTVVVNRAYEGRLTDVHKPLLDMQVPDSVTRFDLDFDYSVFDKPYKGTYEFNPYLLTMQPASSVRAPKQLYLKAGAGYTLHPTLDLVWALPMNGAFRMDAYAFHRSYVGEYRRFIPELVEGETAVIERVKVQRSDKVYYDLETRAGVDASYDWQNGSVTLDASYYGLASEDNLKSRHYDALDVKAGMASKHAGEDFFMYDVDFGYRFGTDAMNFAETADRLDEHVFSVDATLGQVMTKVFRTHKILFDAGLDFASYSHVTYSAAAGQIYITPHYVYDYSKWRVDAGLKFAKMFRSDSPNAIFSANEQVVYPHVYASYDAVPRYLKVYAQIGGGNRMHAYSSILEENHHFDVQFDRGIWPLMDFSVERISASLGFKGHISKFSYDFFGGYVNYANAMLDAIVVAEHLADDTLEYLPGIGYAAYQKAFAAMSLGWESESLRLDADLHYDYSFLARKGVIK